MRVFPPLLLTYKWSVEVISYKYDSIMTKPIKTDAFQRSGYFSGEYSGQLVSCIPGPISGDRSNYVQKFLHKILREISNDWRDCV